MSDSGEKQQVAATEQLSVEVACATRQRQQVVLLNVPPGTTARQAVELAGMADAFPEMDISGSQLGIFGQAVDDNCLLQLGDRVEIYRPLKIDPRAARRQLAARGATMGKAGSTVKKE